MEAQIVIVGYKPKAGKEEALHQLIREHWSILKSEDLITDRPSILMKANDGTVVEVFEWKSREAIENAHENAVVQNMWQQYAEVCDYVPVSTIEEASSLFSSFTPFI